MEITKREVLFSIVIICVMLIIGIIISGNINDAVMEKQQEYITALQIDNDKDLFEYGMRTNVGNAFVYGELKAIDTVTFDEIDGEYSYVKKVKESREEGKYIDDDVFKDIVRSIDSNYVDL